MAGNRHAWRAVVAVEPPLFHTAISTALATAGATEPHPHGTRDLALRWLVDHDVELAIVQMSPKAGSRPRALRELRRVRPHLRIAGFLCEPSRDLMDEARAEGLDVLLCWHCNVSHIVEAVESLRHGQQYACPCCCRLLAHHRLFRNRVSIARPLTPRELEVLRYMAADLDTTQIAETLYISEKTVRTHRGHLMDKLGTRTGPGSILAGIRAGLLEVGGHELP